MDDTLKASIASVVRHLLTAAGAYLVTQGIVTQAAWEQDAASLAMILVGLGWSFYQKHKTTQKLSQTQVNE